MRNIAKINRNQPFVARNAQQGAILCATSLIYRELVEKDILHADKRLVLFIVPGMAGIAPAVFFVLTVPAGI